MKVLYVLRYYPTLSETFVLNEIRELLRTGHSVEVVAIGHRSDGRLARSLPAIRVHRPSSQLPLWTWVHNLSRIDHVHAHFDGEASQLARRLANTLGRPWTVSVHASDLFKPHPGIVDRLRSADAVVTVCRHHQRWLSRRMGVRSTVIHCGVRLPARQATVGLQPARVYSVAREVPKKHLRRLLVVHPKTDWHADRPHEQVLEARFQHQLFALPCRIAPDGDRDGIPVSMMEAMAAGIPVVTRPVSGVNELVDDTTGFIDENFEDALTFALEHPEERVRRGACARLRIERHFSLTTTVSELVQLWGTLRT